MVVKGTGTETPEPRIEDAGDRPQLGRIGIIAAFGFSVGLLWPWLAGVRLVPEAPVEPPTFEAAEAAPSASVTLPPAGASADARVGTPEQVEGQRRLRVIDRVIAGCKSSAGKKVGDCGELVPDAALLGRVEALQGCPGLEGAEGKLSLGLELDFDAGKVTEVTSGKSTTLGRAARDAALECTRSEMKSASLEGVEHEHARYSFFYVIEFLPPDQPAPGADGAAAGPAEVEAAGAATVVWNSAIIRSAAEKDGPRVATLAYGTRVTVLARSGDWYKVRYDSKGNVGWVHGGAIGMK